MTLDELKTNWKKYLIAGGIFIGIMVISNVATGIGCYCKGQKSCVPIEKPVISDSSKTGESHVNKPVEKNNMCGNEIKFKASIDKYSKDSLRIKVYGEDTCKNSTDYFDIAYSCPVYKWSLGISPGLMMNYSLEAQKITMLIGGGINFKRHYGAFSLGPQILYYQSVDSKMFNVGANLLLEYKW